MDTWDQILIYAVSWIICLLFAAGHIALGVWAVEKFLFKD